MRIIGGEFRGRRFSLPKGLKARPTTDFAKEGLFNVLNNLVCIEDATTLDLFSGTGSISFEFVSRGAKEALAIEMYPLHISFINSVCRKLHISNLKVFKFDVYKYISKTDKKFDIIFADAPYADVRLKEIPSLVFENELLDKDGILIVEHSSKNNFADHECFLQERKYGNVHFSIFKN